jgi:trimeric autotransporter adhesin
VAPPRATSIHSLLSVGSDLYVGGSIVSVDGLPIDRIARLSGGQWTSIGGVRGFPNSNLVLSLTLHGGEVVAGGNFTHAGTSFAPGVPVVSNSIASFDGTQWNQIGKGLGFDEVVSAGMLWNGGIVVGGSFTEAGRSIAHSLAFFDGNDWSSLGAFDGPVYDVVVFQNELVVAGAFAAVDGIPMRGVAAFDGSTWHGFGANGFGGGYGGKALAVYQNQLYAGTDGGVMRWNGATWEAFAPQIFGSIGDLHVHNGVLYIAGYFSLMGGHVASWDGVTQRLVGGGADDIVDTLASYGGDLVAGGAFTHAGGVAANRLARWNGSAWSAIPGITGQDVTALTVFRGELYASGNPLLAGQPFQYVARFDGAQWHPLAGGTNGTAGELIPDEAAGRLYVAGSFQDADGRPSWNVAEWIPDPVMAGVGFCAGDGTFTDHATPCPCGNVGSSGHGCANSVDASGALLSATGSAQPDTLALVGAGMPTTSACVYLQGDALSDAPFGDGVRCTGGNLVRLRTRTNVGGASRFPDSTDTLTLSQRGGVAPGSGATRYYQTYYRNAAAAFCPPETFNVTNGVLVVW